jgi:Pyruvate/2-oxoacid:ferredoxin oxidoreductase delta subunit
MHSEMPLIDFCIVKIDIKINYDKKLSCGVCVQFCFSLYVAISFS